MIRREGEDGDKYSRESVIIVEYTVMRRPRCPKKPTMALQVKVELRGVNYIGIHDGAGRTVPTPVGDVWRWEETNVVTFSDNDDSDFGVYFSGLASLWRIMNERRANICRNRQTYLE
jgi:hypothetical protein